MDTGDSVIARENPQKTDVRAQQSAQPPAKKTAGLIKKETQEFTAEFAQNAEKKILDNLCVLRSLR